MNFDRLMAVLSVVLGVVGLVFAVLGMIVAFTADSLKNKDRLRNEAAARKRLNAMRTNRATLKPRNI